MARVGEPVVLQEVRGKVLVITLNRPEVRNAVNRDLAEGLAAALARLDGEDALSLAILTGAGPGFCSGLDLNTFPDGPSTHVEPGGFAGITHRPPIKPVIAAVEGPALAGGFEIVLACDLVVASRAATFGLPEVKRSLVAGSGGLLRLPRQLPYHLAMEMALTGDPVAAPRLEAFGLINLLADDGDALPAALALAGRIVENAPLALRASKRIIAASADRPLEESWAWQQEIIAPVLASQDAAEGARAFVEKRPPVWRGC